MGITRILRRGLSPPLCFLSYLTIFERKARIKLLLRGLNEVPEIRADMIPLPTRLSATNTVAKVLMSVDPVHLHVSLYLAVPLI